MLPRARAAIALSRRGGAGPGRRGHRPAHAQPPRRSPFPADSRPPRPSRCRATRALSAAWPLIGCGRGARPMAAGVVGGWAGGGSAAAREGRAERAGGREGRCRLGAGSATPRCREGPPLLNSLRAARGSTGQGRGDGSGSPRSWESSARRGNGRNSPFEPLNQRGFYREGGSGIPLSFF